MSFYFPEIYYPDVQRLINASQTYSVIIHKLMTQASIRSCACKLIPNEHTDQDTLK